MPRLVLLRKSECLGAHLVPTSQRSVTHPGRCPHRCCWTEVLLTLWQVLKYSEFHTLWVDALAAELLDNNRTMIPLPPLKLVLLYKSMWCTQSTCVPRIRMTVTEFFGRHIIQCKPLTSLWVGFLICVIYLTGERGRKQVVVSPHI